MNTPGPGDTLTYGLIHSHTVLDRYWNVAKFLRGAQTGNVFWAGIGTLACCESN